MREKYRSEEHNTGTWEQLTHGRTAERLGRGQVLYTPDQAADEVLLLTSGRIGLHLLSAEGRSLMLHEVEPGQLFGHVAMSSSETYDTYAETLSNVTLYRIPRAALLQMFADSPDLVLAMVDDLGRYQALVSRRLDEVTFKSVPARLASLLLDMANRHDATSKMHVPRRSHRQLAEMINAYRETVTKQINQFRAARLLEIDRSGFTLVNLPRLEELAQGW
ncbi:MAG TPA: Crp/Fnr family transcriptional regulator [Roseiflexaceae bacterium]|jgi:CRP-like cAMP-binding protein|nr:Crp/Fnr family transcriptional regulator [Roseiflexaceae bacterium]